MLDKGMIKINSRCRDCQSTHLEKFLDLGMQPLANNFLELEHLKTEESKYPLEVYVCLDCNLAQLLLVVDRQELFSHYVYFSSGMPKISPHWRVYAEDVIERFLERKDFVFEIASNDGILLNFFQESGYRVLGMDPAENIVPVAEMLGVPTIVDFFDEKIAKEIQKEFGYAKAILANNVVSKIPQYTNTHGLQYSSTHTSEK